MEKKNGEINLKDILHLFISKAWVIALVALIAGMAMGIYSGVIKKDTYSSQSTLMVSKENTTVDNSDITLASKMVETYKVIIYSDSFLTSVIEDINHNSAYADYRGDLSVTGLKNALTVQQCGETEVFDITVTTGDPKLSYAIAETLSKRIKDALPDILPYPEGVIYTSIIDPANLPNHANSKHTARNVVLGLLVGAVVAMLVLFLVWNNDIVIRNRKDLEENLDLPVLGVIPRFEVEEKQ